MESLIILIILTIIIAKMIGSNNKQKVKILIFSLFIAKPLSFLGGLGNRIICFDLACLIFLISLIKQKKIHISRVQPKYKMFVILVLSVYYMSSWISLIYSYNTQMTLTYILILTEMLIIYILFSKYISKYLGINELLKLIGDIFCYISIVGIIIYYFIYPLKKMILSDISDNGVYRWILTFASPNQLGLYALVCFCIYIVDFLSDRKHTLKNIIRMFLALGMIMMSGSDFCLAIACIVVLLTLIIMYKTVINKTILKVSISIIISSFIIVNSGILQSNIIKRVMMIVNTNSIQDLYTIAGSTRMNQILYTLPEVLNNTLGIGVGVGAFATYSSIKYGVYNEMHNLYLSVLAENGLIGALALYILLIMTFYISTNMLIKNYNLVNIKLFILLTSVLIYGIAHNLIRQRIFWIILGLILCSKDKCSKMAFDEEREII